MKETNSITVYWASAAYLPELESWSMLYQEPIHILSESNKLKNKKWKTPIQSCPAHIALMKNVFKVDNVLKTHVTIPEWVHKEQELKKGIDDSPISTYRDFGGLELRVERPTSFEGHTNFIYNMSWLFFADEPVTVRVTAPYFPAVSPGKNVILSAGEYDIGSWYRKIELDYHVPYTTETLDFEENQSLFYMEFKTTKKIIFKRYLLTKELENLSKEVSLASSTHGRFKPLTDRYALFKKTAIREQVLKHITNNLVE